MTNLARSRAALGEAGSGYQGLGFRGITIEALMDDLISAHGLPPVMRIAGGSSQDEQRGLEIAERLISTMQKQTMTSVSGESVKVDEKLVESILNQLKSRISTTASEPDVAGPEGPTKTPMAAAVTCFIELGAFNPAFWNDPAHIGRNNCYNYGSNRRTDTFAQPGRASGHPITGLNCAAVTTAALSDGLHKRFNCFPDSEKPRWLMALVVAPGYDYHWYRKQKEGFWGHKPGGTAARNVDNNGHVVSNPETCARAPYTDFCGYFYACRSQRIA
ncbi:MAG: hypothetical protein ACHQPI_00410 [Thermoanaerobaculia bacterium]